MLIPYEQYYVQTLHQEGKVSPEQYPGEQKPLFQTTINLHPLHTLHEKTSRAITCSPDTTPAYPHLSSNLQQLKVCTISDSQY